MKSHWHNRLEQLESHWPEPAPTEHDAEQERAREQAAWELVETMAPDHQRMLAEAPGPGDPVGMRLLAVAQVLVGRYVFEGIPRRLALPAAVAECYLSDNRLKPRFSCESCGLLLPTLSGIAQVKDQSGVRFLPPAYSPFSRCPACDGLVAENGFERTLHGQIRRCDWCGELDPQTDEQRHHLWSKFGGRTCGCERSQQ